MLSELYEPKKGEDICQENSSQEPIKRLLQAPLIHFYYFIYSRQRQPKVQTMVDLVSHSP